MKIENYLGYKDVLGVARKSFSSDRVIVLETKEEREILLYLIYEDLSATSFFKILDFIDGYADKYTREYDSDFFIYGEILLNKNSSKHMRILIYFDSKHALTIRFLLINWYYNSYCKVAPPLGLNCNKAENYDKFEMDYEKSFKSDIFTIQYFIFTLEKINLEKNKKNIKIKFKYDKICKLENEIVSFFKKSKFPESLSYEYFFCYENNFVIRIFASKKGYIFKLLPDNAHDLKYLKAYLKSFIVMFDVFKMEFFENKINTDYKKISKRGFKKLSYKEKRILDFKLNVVKNKLKVILKDKYIYYYEDNNSIEININGYVHLIVNGDSFSFIDSLEKVLKLLEEILTIEKLENKWRIVLTSQTLSYLEGVLDFLKDTKEYLKKEGIYFRYAVQEDNFVIILKKIVLIYDFYDREDYDLLVTLLNLSQEKFNSLGKIKFKTSELKQVKGFKAYFEILEELHLKILEKFPTMKYKYLIEKNIKIFLSYKNKKVNIKVTAKKILKNKEKFIENIFDFIKLYFNSDIKMDYYSGKKRIKEIFNNDFYKGKR